MKGIRKTEVCSISVIGISWLILLPGIHYCDKEALEAIETSNAIMAFEHEQPAYVRSARIAPKHNGDFRFLTFHDISHGLDPSDDL